MWFKSGRLKRAMKLELCLRLARIWSPEVAELLRESGIETIGDLAFTFRTAEEVVREVPGLLEAWLHVANQRRTSLGEARATFMLGSHAGGDTGIAVQRAAVVSLPVGAKARPPCGRPRPGRTVDVKKEDESRRSAAATAAVALSLS